jgi:hypothetical protein
VRRLMAAGVAIVVLLALTGPATLAQYEGHPNVGTWINDEDPEDPDNPLSLASVNNDGTVTEWNQNEGGFGSWEPTGERTFMTTTLYPLMDDEAGFLGFLTARIIGEISEDGQIATGTYTLEFPDGPAGFFPPPGEWGPAPFYSTRLNVEPPGQTVGPWPLVPSEQE